MPRLSLTPIPINFPFVLKLSTALERHVSWNYLDFCGYFFSDWVLRPDSFKHQYSQDQAVCAFTICGCGLSQKDFKSFLAAGERLRLFSGNWCGHISAQNKSEGALAPRAFLPEAPGQCHLADGPYTKAVLPPEAKQSRADFPPYISGWQKNPKEKRLVTSVLVACSLLGKVHLFRSWGTADDFLKASSRISHSCRSITQSDPRQSQSGAKSF